MCTIVEKVLNWLLKLQLLIFYIVKCWENPFVNEKLYFYWYFTKYTLIFLEISEQTFWGVL